MDKLIASCLDVTTLSDATDTKELANDALKIGAAAVCVYPNFIKDAKEAITAAKSSMAVATVVNFPRGSESVWHDDAEETKKEISEAVEAGCDEIDIVFPYRIYMQKTDESKHKTEAFMKAVLGAIPKNIKTKVILESGIMCDEELLRSACQMCINAGVNFLKTSTGKVPVGARPEEAKILVEEIVKSGKPVGIKVSGGVRTKADAEKYIELAKATGLEVKGPSQLRIGASKLHKELV
eukprot:Protomagalhaensia_wolfi_Nauph_80__3038@NODE_3113_length_886_cov_4644_005903_g2413_i1_p1_GENE_NODE_3113_length_886_cov_4644_005903_g2413_i1NODE_3113_length_886_cov_4644_005903_g2413_i1_p1_ORF_typecomplete_len238_score87_18DeoC/PF01791_9/3_2e39DHDPS/PF00701_22/0_42DHDPS/PF00701_22/12DHDPS/PF00701_22/61CoA_binding_2/PF13380_6/21CoA_binding_2/PF13380_6/3_6e02CoA_binding_2/PF13380_6/2_9His_biosynth/PF00977_21/1_1e02His_biosynth/PF00977_21/1e02His_biosynth/PF00977_21/1_4ThiG/PF05690_14/88ThiG/PF05690_